MSTAIATTEKISVANLRALIGSREGMKTRERLPAKGVAAGVPRGALVEVVGASRTEWVVDLLAKNPDLSVAWVEDELSVLPTAIAQRNAGLERILFIEAQDEVDWAVHTLLRSQLFVFIVTAGGIQDERQLRRYQLLAEQANTSVVLLSERPSSAWCVALQIESSSEKCHLLNSVRAPHLKIRVLKNK